MRMLVLAALALALAASAASGAIQPRIVTTATAPLTVRGTSFAPGERVTILAQTDLRRVRIVTASARGTFLVRFPAMVVDGCTAYLLRATTPRGVSVIRKVVPVCPNLQPVDG
jgi:hypothetical protein